MVIENIVKNEFDRYEQYFDFEKIRGKKFLVTGAKGFLGSALIKFLLYFTKKLSLNVSIYAITRVPNKLPDYVSVIDPIKYITFDSLESQNVRFDYIVHTAAPTSRLTFINDPLGTFDIIVNGTRKILDYAKNTGAESVLYLSSVEIYGSPKETEPVKESYCFAMDPAEIRNSYPLGKKCAEYLCNTYHSLYNLPVNIVRPSSVQGLFQPYTEDRIFNQILRCIIEEKDLVMRTKGETAKTLIYTLDAILGMLEILTSKKYGETYNLTDKSTFYMMKDIASMLFEQFGGKSKVVFDLQDDSKTGYIAPLSYELDMTKLESIGWSCHTDLTKMYEVDIERFTTKR